MEGPPGISALPHRFPERDAGGHEDGPERGRSGGGADGHGEVQLPVGAREGGGAGDLRRAQAVRRTDALSTSVGYTLLPPTVMTSRSGPRNRSHSPSAST